MVSETPAFVAGTNKLWASYIKLKYLSYLRYRARGNELHDHRSFSSTCQSRESHPLVHRNTITRKCR
ncbi:hypothetical protein VTJ04DRAFT_1044 [Mycothermus thermophilus]|uniref:uncharacterized protein n=1 Tax=Humicola insolens TaxID=85995 RepID=UPI003742D308